MIKPFHLSILLDHQLQYIMNKENHASRRLGCASHTESGDEIVRYMSETTGSNEPNAYDSGTETQGFLYRHPAVVGTIATSYIATVIIYLLMTRMWNEDEIKLHILSTLTRLFQALARTFGLWALQTENAYNEYVSILH